MLYHENNQGIMHNKNLKIILYCIFVHVQIYCNGLKIKKHISLWTFVKLQQDQTSQFYHKVALQDCI